ncbi:hypothetical protein F8M41_001208 [Gigaspora margarita]|uniref:Uncharacterized protein n=1 Tax=Gigaspora margarita TaxID=4874 RepID=A0A8H3XH73_GIGMA|nr:hypothetical protein F8M41_001208 [Gigaspora margarita]
MLKETTNIQHSENLISTFNVSNELISVSSIEIDKIQLQTSQEDDQNKDIQEQSQETSIVVNNENTLQLISQVILEIDIVVNNRDALQSIIQGKKKHTYGICSKDGHCRSTCPNKK